MEIISSRHFYEVQLKGIESWYSTSFFFSVPRSYHSDVKSGLSETTLRDRTRDILQFVVGTGEEWSTVIAVGQQTSTTVYRVPPFLSGITSWWQDSNSLNNSRVGNEFIEFDRSVMSVGFYFSPTKVCILVLMYVELKKIRNFFFVCVCVVINTCLKQKCPMCSRFKREIRLMNSRCGRFFYWKFLHVIWSWRRWNYFYKH